MKKLISIILLTAMLLALVPGASADEPEEQQQLSGMSEQECINFIKSYGVPIPDDYTDQEWGPFIKFIIETVEEDPACAFQFTYRATQTFAEDIQQAVWSYYGYTEEQLSSFPSTYSMNYTLQESERVGNWRSEYKNYNCYAYALYDPSIDDEPTKELNIGDIRGSTASPSLSLDDLTEIVMEDLDKDGKCVVDYDYTSVLEFAPYGDYLICLRKGTTSYNNEISYDYHFMKYDSGDWYHKPGQSIPLRYLSTPNSSDNWLLEGYGSGGAYYNANLVYTGTINYIVYNAEHDFGIGVYTGTNYHSNKTHYYQYQATCSVCGHKTKTYYTSVACSGPPCPIYAPYSIQPAAIEESH